ncbi:MAG: hypothetical protein KGL52_15750 [Rhodospirillales bacterium]|jgi:hypothetical protein|nr:hypothetical protein [Rhodospirillales bacterium]
MRNILLASVGVLALTASVAFADGYRAPSNSTTNTALSVAVPIKNASAANGSNAATSGGTAGSQNGNSMSVPIKNASAANGSSAATSGGTAGSYNGNSLGFSSSESVNKNFSANSGGSGGSASATNDGVAVNKPNSDNTAFALLGMAVSNGNLSATRTEVTTTYTFGNSNTSDSVGHNTIGAGSSSGWDGRGGSSPAGSGNVSMTSSMGGLGILTAQQNTGAAVLQQNSPVLTSIVQGGTGTGIGH